MNENNTKVIFNYNGEVNFVELTPEQIKLLDFLENSGYFVYDLSIMKNPEFEKI